MATTVALARPPPPSLQEATKNSTKAWQEHLSELFQAAKDRFPDVVWELVTEQGPSQEVWGHKGAESAVSLDTARTPSPFRSGSPTSIAPTPAPGATSSNSTTSAAPLLRLTTTISPALFSNELEYLYTGKGFGEAFEFLFDSAETRLDPEDGEELRIDKLRKDLVFMWRSRLYSDVKISLTGNFSSSGNHENTTAIFSSHRFVLVSRSAYFHTALIGWPTSPAKTSSAGEQPMLTLPSPPFTPASVHFTLGFLYTGTLVFSHRTYDLSTAFAILRAALYLSIPTLHDEIQARIIQEMLHGLFHAFITFAEYDSLTSGKWGTGGCRCRQCARRAPRVLEFAIADDVKNPHLERGGRRALVGLFGEGWCTQEFASLSPKIHESVLKGVAKRSTPQNVLALLFAAEHAFAKLGAVIDPWADTIRDLILQARKTVDEALCREAEVVFGMEDWVEIMESDGVRFEDGERVEWVMASILRGVKETNAPMVYQTLVSGILLRPHPTDSSATLLGATSHVRVQVEQTRVELLKWIGKRWFAIRQERAFDALEGWALKEISDHIEVALEDLLNPPPPSYSSGKSGSPSHHANKQRNVSSHLRPISNHPHTSRVDADSGSSMRPSVLTRSFKQSTLSSTDLSSSRSSVHSLARSVVSTTSTARMRNPSSGISPAKKIINQTRAAAAAGSSASVKDSRPDSKFTDTDSQIYDDADEGLNGDDDDSDGHGHGSDENGEDRTGGGYDDEDDVDDRSTVASSVVSDHDGPSPSRSKSRTSSSRPSLSGSTSTAGPRAKTLITKASVASAMSRVGKQHAETVGTRRPKSPSASSVHSKASTIRKSSTTFASAKTSPGGNSRPVSRGSHVAPKLTINPAASKSSINTNTSTPSRSTSRASRVSTLSTSTRPVSTASVSSTNTATTESAMTFRTASGGTTPGGLTTPVVERPRRLSTASSVASSVRTTGAVSPGGAGLGDRDKDRQRKVSTASVSSVASARSAAAAASRARVSSSPSVAKKAQQHLPVVVPGKPTRSVSSSSAGSSKSATGKGVGVGKGGKKPAVVPEVPPVPNVEDKVGGGDDEKEDKEQEKREDEDVGDVTLTVPPPPPSVPVDANESMIGNTSSTLTIKPKPLPPLEHKKTDSAASTVSTASSSSATTLKKRGSNDTIRTVKSNLAPSVKAPSTITTITSSSAASSLSKPSSASLRDAASIPSLPSPTPTPNPLPTLPMPSSPPLPPLPAPSTHTPQPSSSLPLPTPTPFSTVPRGATLDIGIPCIISSKRKRFKAYARYIGEVEGESGPWVGVEVPLPIPGGGGAGESWGDRDMLGSQILSNHDDRAWHDGSWGGIRYFEMSGGGNGSEWEYNGASAGGGGLYGGDEGRAARRRRTDPGNTTSMSMMSSSPPMNTTMTKFGVTFSTLKREGDAISIASERMKRMRSASPAVSDMSSGMTESRGLFVRPQQVLYVVDAVGSDL